MLNEIETALNAKGFITNVVVERKTVEFEMNGISYFAKLVQGKFNQDNMRRASY